MSTPPPSLEAQYQALADLREIDERTFRVERDSERIPDEIQKQDSALAQKRVALDAAKAQAAECEKKLRAAERDLKEKEEFLFKAEGKMMEVKTNQEYQAALKENQNQKSTKGVLEEKVLLLLNEVEAQKQALVGIEDEFKVHEQSILQEKKKLNDEQAELMAVLEKLLRQRQSLVTHLDSNTAATYQKILAGGKNVPVAVAEKGRCLACNLQVRPQIYNEVLGYKAIHRCPSCGRILIVTSRATPAEGEPTLGAK